jgi:hypothetical protein
MSALSKTVGKSGGTLRDEMLAMGFSYEEQGAIVAQLGAQMKASGQDIRNMAPSELARQTKEYATNLKVISDITGQDAKKLAEKARAESMRGALQGKLDAQQQKAFSAAHQTLMTLGPEAGPKMQQALMQMLTGGAVTDPVIAGNAEAMELIKKTAEGVQAGNQDMIVQTQQGTSEFANKMRESGETATSTAAVMSSSFGGVGKDMATFGDSVRAFSQLGADAAEKSKDNAVKQSEATDNMTQGYVKITDQMQNFGREMEKFTGEHLDSYAKLLRQNADLTMKAMGEALVVLDKGVDQYAKDKAKDAGLEPDKVGGALAGAAGGAVAGAAIGTVVPVIGTAVGAAIGGLVGGAAGWFSSKGAKKGAQSAANEEEFAIPQAAGGIIAARNGGTLVKIAEAGLNEANVPLPDGRRIPVDMPVGELLSGFSDTVGKFAQQQSSAQAQTTEKLDETMKLLLEKFDKLADHMGSKGDEHTGLFAEITDHMKDMRETALKQLDAHDVMKRTLADSKDNLSGILNNIM